MVNGVQLGDPIVVKQEDLEFFQRDPEFFFRNFLYLKEMERSEAHSSLRKMNIYSEMQTNSTNAQ